MKHRKDRLEAWVCLIVQIIFSAMVLSQAFCWTWSQNKLVLRLMFWGLSIRLVLTQNLLRFQDNNLFLLVTFLMKNCLLLRIRLSIFLQDLKLVLRLMFWELSIRLVLTQNLLRFQDNNVFLLVIFLMKNCLLLRIRLSIFLQDLKLRNSFVNLYFCLNRTGDLDKIISLSKLLSLSQILSLTKTLATC
jgi:hypothetical protein